MGPLVYQACQDHMAAQVVLVLLACCPIHLHSCQAGPRQHRLLLPHSGAPASMQQPLPRPQLTCVTQCCAYLQKHLALAMGWHRLACRGPQAHMV